jgi:hypothetical protein
MPVTNGMRCPVDARKLTFAALFHLKVNSMARIVQISSATFHQGHRRQILFALSQLARIT